MTNSPVRLPASDSIAPPPSDAVHAYVAQSLASSTVRAYRAALSDFGRWCDERGLQPVPAAPETIANYLAELADRGRKPSTIAQRVAAIRWAHEAAGQEDPTRSKGVRATVAGIRRAKGIAPEQKAPITVERLAAMVAHADSSTLKGLRDRALLLFGFASALRRSELVGLDVEDLEGTEQGLLVSVHRSKSDQEAKGQLRAVPIGRTELCPVASIRLWLEAADVTRDRVFRSVSRHGRVGDAMTSRAIADVVKAYAKSAGFEPGDFSGHSLRAGFVTSAAERGARPDRIMDHTGHRSIAMVQTYTRRHDAFADHAGTGLL